MQYYLYIGPKYDANTTMKETVLKECKISSRSISKTKMQYAAKFEVNRLFSLKLGWFGGIVVEIWI